MKVHEKQDLCHHNVWWYLLIIKRKNSNLTAEKTDTSTKWFKFNIQSSSSPVQSLSRVRLFSTPWNAAQGLPVHHQLLEFTQTHVHWAGDAIQPSHPLLFPSPPAFSVSQHQGLFKWVLHHVVKLLAFQLQHTMVHIITYLLIWGIEKIYQHLW